MANTYDVGDRPKITFTFTAVSSGDAADPTEVTITIRDPSGNVDTHLYTAAEVTREETGIFWIRQTIDEEGHWHYRAVAENFGGDADEQTAVEGTFIARQSVFS